MMVWSRRGGNEGVRLNNGGRKSKGDSVPGRYSHSWDNEKKTKVVKTLGNYERMLAEDPDIIQKLKQEAAAITKAKKESRTPITLQLQVADITSPAIVKKIVSHVLGK